MIGDKKQRGGVLDSWTNELRLSLCHNTSQSDIRSIPYPHLSRESEASSLSIRSIGRSSYQCARQLEVGIMVRTPNEPIPP